VLLNARKDVAQPGHSHWDDLVVEVREGEPTEPPPDPVPGERHTIQVYLDGQKVVDEKFLIEVSGFTFKPAMPSLIASLLSRLRK
jgi:hypothetical protein